MAIAALIVAVVAAGAAIGSVAVARRAANGAARSANEARKQRLDELGPHVFIADPVPMRERWNVGDIGDVQRFDPGLAEPGKGLESPGNDDWRLLIGATLQVENQGERSARLSISGAQRVDIDQPMSSRAPIPLRRPMDADNITLKPGKSIGLVIRTGPTLRDWMNDGDQPQIATIRAETGPDAAAQEWDLILAGQILTSVPQNASRFIVLPHVPVDARLVQKSRKYPDS